MKRLPARLYICPCGYQTEYRWVLAQHLRNVHGLGKRASREMAVENEYWARPKYYKRSTLEKEEIDEEVRPDLG